MNLRQNYDDDPDPKRKKVSGDNIGINLYQSQITTQALKRPLKWFFNVMLQKPNHRFYKEAEYNGLRYQTEELEDNLQREYEDYVRQFYDERLNIYEQKIINMKKLQVAENKKKLKFGNLDAVMLTKSNGHKSDSKDNVIQSLYPEAKLFKASK
jgi:hypothetical protein